MNSVVSFLNLSQLRETFRHGLKMSGHLNNTTLFPPVTRATSSAGGESKITSLQNERCVCVGGGLPV